MTGLSQRWWIGVVVACGLVGAEARADRQSAAILVQSSVNVGNAEVQVLVAAMAEALGSQPGIAVQDPEESARRVPTLEAECLADVHCLKGAASKLGVRDVLLVSVLRVGDEFQVETTWVSGVTGAVALRPKVRVPVATGNFTAVFAERVGELLPPHRQDAKPLPPRAAKEDSSGPSRAPMWIAVGVSGAGLVTGTVLAAVALDRFNDCADGGEAVPCERERIDGLDSWQLGADIALGVGIGAGLTALGLYLFGPSGDESSGAVLSAQVGEGGGQVLLRGSF